MIRIIKESIEDDFDKFDLGEDWIANIPKECIKGATLLSKEEYKKYKDDISLTDDYWWLRSLVEDGSGGVFYVEDDGIISNNQYVDDEYGIRPSLILNLQSANLNLDDDNKFELGEHSFTILSNDLAICDDIIDYGCFRKDRGAKDANIYERSDIKKVVDNWFNKAYAEYEG